MSCSWMYKGNGHAKVACLAGVSICLIWVFITQRLLGYFVTLYISQLTQYWREAGRQHSVCEFNAVQYAEMIWLGHRFYQIQHYARAALYVDKRLNIARIIVIVIKYKCVLSSAFLLCSLQYTCKCYHFDTGDRTLNSLKCLKKWIVNWMVTLRSFSSRFKILKDHVTAHLSCLGYVLI